MGPIESEPDRPSTGPTLGSGSCGLPAHLAEPLASNYRGVESNFIVVKASHMDEFIHPFRVSFI